MRDGLCAGHRQAMADTRITIVIELDEIEDCPVGSAHLSSGARRPFHGWLGLTEAIDSLAALAAGPPAAKPPANGTATRPSERRDW